MYATVADIESRYGSVCFALAGKTAEGELDRGRMESALAEAGSEIDMALAHRYALPLSPVPSVLRRVAVDLAVAALPQNGATEASVYERRGREARALLASIAKGDISLGAETPPAQGGLSGGGMVYAGPQSGFRNKLEEL